VPAVEGGRDGGAGMSAVQVASFLWPVLLVPIGVLIGRAMRRTDSREAATFPAVPTMAEDAAVVRRDVVGPEPTGAAETDDDPGPEAAHPSEVPVPR
jgi:hypothetical protein